MIEKNKLNATLYSEFFKAYYFSRKYKKLLPQTFKNTILHFILFGICIVKRSMMGKYILKFEYHVLSLFDRTENCK